MSNRFLIVELDLDPKEPPIMKVATEQEVSKRIDEADLYDSPFKIFYLTNRGAIVPVKAGKYTPIPGCMENEYEGGITCAHTELYAGKKRVGYVTHTDH